MAEQFPDDGVEVAVAVEVGEAGRAALPHIDAVERIGGAGDLGEGRRDGRAGVLEIVQGAEPVPDDEVEVAVAVEIGEAGRAEVTHIDAVERIGGAGARGEGRRDGRAGVLEIVQVAVLFPDDGVEVAVAVEVGEARRAEEPHIDAVQRICHAGLLREQRDGGGEAGGVGDLELEAAARGRRIGGIGVGQVLDQRLDPRRRRRRVEGDGQRAASAAREAADDAAAEADVAAGDADLARAGALVADRHCVLRQQARDRQRATVEVVVGIGEGDVRIDDLRSGVDRVLEKGDRGGEAGQGGNRVRHLLVLRVARGQKPSCELRPPPPRSPHWSSRGMPVFPPSLRRQIVGDLGAGIGERGIVRGRRVAARPRCRLQNASIDGRV